MHNSSHSAKVLLLLVVDADVCLEPEENKVERQKMKDKLQKESVFPCCDSDGDSQKT